LDAAGARLENVVKTTVYVASDDQNDLIAAWKVVSRHFGDHDAPSTLLGVSVLGIGSSSSRSRRSPRFLRASLQ
jgi:enamine deaminase RidA (YjgF/YER057c/UK114 family)